MNLKGEITFISTIDRIFDDMGKEWCEISYPEGYDSFGNYYPSCTIERTLDSFHLFFENYNSKPLTKDRLTRYNLEKGDQFQTTIFFDYSHEIPFGDTLICVSVEKGTWTIRNKDLLYGLYFKPSKEDLQNLKAFIEKELANG